MESLKKINDYIQGKKIIKTKKKKKKKKKNTNKIKS